MFCLGVGKKKTILALRHELGHILGDIGEEYDAGGDYSGPNFAETRRFLTLSDSHTFPSSLPALFVLFLFLSSFLFG